MLIAWLDVDWKRCAIDSSIGSDLPDDHFREEVSNGCLRASEKKKKVDPSYELRPRNGGSRE